MRTRICLKTLSLLCLTVISQAGLATSTSLIYPSNKMVNCKTYIPHSDPGRIRDESLLGDQYGQNEDDVQSHLETVYWMEEHFGRQYPLAVTTINDVHIKLTRVSKELEKLASAHPEFLKYLDHPAGAFYWRYIENSDRRSPHSYGIAMDLNVRYTNYWIWDTGIKTNLIGQRDSIPYQNQIPCEIVSIFEKHGFIWGGKWMHYDTMHFEYRPELLTSHV